MTLSSSKQRTTWTIASVSRMLARNWLPRPSPFDAPATRPAMSTNSTIAGTIFCGLTIAGERVQPRVGHLDDADVRLDRAERIVLGRDAGLGQRVEEGGLADVGQADDAAFEAHVCRSVAALRLAHLRVCSAIIARSMSPAAIVRAMRRAPRSIAASIASRSSRRAAAVST